uniref:Uncharacterized protein n=1 Tax=Parastrongyloides trichosuri TaxID=131310 RepID=A0A0N4ZWE9_PARTI
MHIIINITNFIILILISFINGAPSLTKFNADKNLASPTEVLRYTPLSQAHAVPQIATEPEVNPDDGDFSMFRFINPAQLPNGATLVTEEKDNDESGDAFVLNMPHMEMENNPEGKSTFYNTKAIGEVPALNLDSPGLIDSKPKSKSGNENPIVNPASYFLAGGNFDKIEQPNCQMVGCDGPFPEDVMNHILEPFTEMSENNVPQTCKQHFVPLNSCVNNKGYPIGMICTICCECSNEFIEEVKKTNGYKQGKQ